MEEVNKMLSNKEVDKKLRSLLLELIHYSYTEEGIMPSLSVENIPAIQSDIVDMFNKRMEQYADSKVEEAYQEWHGSTGL